MVQTRNAGRSVSTDLAGGIPPSELLALQDGFTFEAQILDDLSFYYIAQFDTYGAVRYATEVTLPRNALVETFDVTVTAARATLALASEVAQVRAGPSTEPMIGDKGLSVVVDFGTLRTVSAITVPPPFKIASVRTWNGAQFMTPPAYAAVVTGSTSGSRELNVTPTGPVSTVQRAVLSTEPRTERLSIAVAGPSDSSDLVTRLALVLPDAPADLELRVDGQAPAWTHPGAAQPGASPTVTDQAWSQLGERIVHLGDALGALTGDPTADGDRTFELKLTSRAPGLLKIEERQRQLKRIRRALFGGRPETAVEFGEEGAVELVLAVPELPAASAVLEVRLTAEADFGPERTLPPVGPEPFPTVDLMLDQDRAVLIQLRPGTGLEELTAVRLPLAAGEGGAEARVVLWPSGGELGGEPVEPIPEATSQPQTLATGVGGGAWTTFRFPKGVVIDPDKPPSAAVLVTRGQAVLSLAVSSGAGDPLDAQSFRMGPHGGPWSLPPAGLRAGAFAAVRGAARMTGLAPKERPLPPLAAAVVGADAALLGLDPGRRGIRTVIPGGAAGKQLLRLIAYGPGTLTLRDVDVVSLD